MFRVSFNVQVCTNNFSLSSFKATTKILKTINCLSSSTFPVRVHVQKAEERSWVRPQRRLRRVKSELAECVRQNDPAGAQQEEQEEEERFGGGAPEEQQEEEEENRRLRDGSVLQRRERSGHGVTC